MAAKNVVEADATNLKQNKWLPWQHAACQGDIRVKVSDTFWYFFMEETKPYFVSTVVDSINYCCCHQKGRVSVSSRHLSSMFAMSHFIRQMCLHLSACDFTLFLVSQEPPWASANTLLSIGCFFPSFWHFHPNFLMECSKMCIQLGRWKPSQ